MGQDQVSGGVSVLCLLAAPVAMFYGNLQNLVIRAKSVIKYWCNIWSIEDVIVYGNVPECHERYDFFVIQLNQDSKEISLLFS